MDMAEKNGEENHKFIYKGLTSKSYHKAAKKYFDNLIYKIKNQMNSNWLLLYDLNEHIIVLTIL